MTIYNINLGIGWASSGVEYAQAYRAQLFRQIEQPAKFIFTDMILADNIQHLTENIGFHDDEIIWLYNAFTDVKIAPTTYTIQQVLDSFSGDYIRFERNGKICRFFYPKNQFITCYLKDEKEDFVQCVEHVSQGRLLRKDYFSYVRYATEYFIPHEGKASLCQRRFYQEDGTVAYDILLEKGREVLYRFPDKILYSKQELVAYFLEQLKLQADDMLIIDRATGIGQGLLQAKGAAKVGVIVHAQHFSPRATNSRHILWNNYYEYVFSNADKIDFFLVSTDQQKEELTQHFRQYSSYCPSVFTIPVGYVPYLIGSEKKRNAFSLMTASRLVVEKHIDWLVDAVVEVKKILPEITFYIYGTGQEKERLAQLIDQHQASSYIFLMGHQPMATIYPQHEVYLTASTGEGFGLTLLEALSAGLPLIGLDVPYGNQHFIQNGENGFLLNFTNQSSDREIISNFVERILEVYQRNLWDSMSEKAYARAEAYLTKEVGEKWLQLFKEVWHDSAI